MFQYAFIFALFSRFMFILIVGRSFDFVYCQSPFYPLCSIFPLSLRSPLSSFSFYHLIFVPNTFQSRLRLDSMHHFSNSCTNVKKTKRRVYSPSKAKLRDYASSSSFTSSASSSSFASSSSSSSYSYSPLPPPVQLPPASSSSAAWNSANFWSTRSSAR